MKLHDSFMTHAFKSPLTSTHNTCSFEEGRDKEGGGYNCDSQKV